MSSFHDAPRHARRMRTLAVACMLAASASAFATAGAQDHAPHAHDAVRPTANPARIDVPLDAALIATLPRESVRATAHGKALACEGVPLVALLKAAKAMPDTPLRGPQLARVVVVTARDGYRAAFSLAELDLSLGANPVLLTNRCNGAALDADDGPWRLVAPTESRPARWVRQVESITVVDAP